jgi:HlyD family secretion protein
MKRALWAMTAAAVAAAGYAGWRAWPRRAGGEEIRTARVGRGEIVQIVRATGIVQPIRMVDVGTQVNGPVLKLYVDYNDSVREGDLVAQIDPIVFEARLAQDEANLTQAEAHVVQVRSRLAQTSNEVVRAETLARRDMISQAELEGFQAERDSLAAEIRVAEAAVEQARAALRLSRANLGYTTIRSPVNGVVIARNVSEGQTVVASLSAQVLFKIATDLSRIQIEASVPEADIGRIAPGQPVTFTVDAYEGSFTGTVAQVRLAAASVQNVVTYPVIVLADNPGTRLFPGMTANIACEVDRRPAALRVPNAALRFQPSASAGVGPDAGTPPGAAAGERTGRVWVVDSAAAQPRAVPVALGISDGGVSEVVEPTDLLEGNEVAIGYASKAEDRQAPMVNPFAMPTPPGMRRRTR